MTPAAQHQTEALADVLAAGPALVVTGAGISTGSGIPDYRDRDGRMRHAAPMTFQRFVGSLDDRRRYWARSHVGWPRVAAARPNSGHRAVAALQAAGLVSGVVTQNVDGLHGAAGTRDVIDLHGRLDAVVCLDCGTRRPRLEMGLRLDAVNPGFRERLAADAASHSFPRNPPSHRPDGDVVIPEPVVAGFRLVDCRACGGVLKPDVVFFGEHVPSVRFRTALDLLDRSAGLLVLGSSLMVGSGFRFVTAAVRRGVPVAIVTRGTTRGDRLASLKIDAPLGDVLPALVTATVGRTQPAANAPALAG